MAKVARDPELRKRIRQLKRSTAYLCEPCQCGRTFGAHGATPPHTHMGNEDGHSECRGFAAESLRQKTQGK